MEKKFNEKMRVDRRRSDSTLTVVMNIKQILNYCKHNIPKDNINGCESSANIRLHLRIRRLKKINPHLSSYVT